MSKSLARVRDALTRAGMDIEILKMDDSTRTADDAARAAGCGVDQIAKSIIFRTDPDTDADGRAVLFITAGGNNVDPAKAATVAGQPLFKADAALIRAQTGYAIGGIAPVGHLTPTIPFFDPRLLDFDLIWAAAGTPRHIFAINPSDLLAMTSAVLADFTR